MNAPTAAMILQRNAELLEPFLRESLNSHSKAPARLRESIEYSLFAAGKRLRPALVLESWRACNGVDESQQAALAAAAAVEMVHTFSLVHDDLPAMDDDDLRRGKPTNHKIFGEAMAILAGDALLTMAFEVIARHAPPLPAIAMLQDLAGYAGAQGMIGGQALDILSENQQLSLEQIQRIHRQKTAALITASCRLGAHAAAAHPPHLEALTGFGMHLGQAFQIIDDMLDVTSTHEQLGKATNKDATRGKNTYPALIGLEGSRAQAEEHVQSAISAVEPLGPGAVGLIELARFVTSRTS